VSREIEISAGLDYMGKGRGKRRLHMFGSLFNRMYKPLCSFCMRMVFLKEIAEELVRDVFFGIGKLKAD
jgi:hypothetical protein